MSVWTGCFRSCLSVWDSLSGHQHSPPKLHWLTDKLHLMESNLAHQMCVSACICVCVFVPSLLSVDTKRQPSAREQRRERGEKKQANSPFLSNYKWQTCYQESVWHLTTHDNLSALCQYSVTDWRLSVCVCMCVSVNMLTDRLNKNTKSNSVLPRGSDFQWQSKKSTANISPIFLLFPSLLPF